MGFRCWFYGHKWTLVERAPGNTHFWVCLYCPVCHRERVGQDTKDRFTDDQLGKRVEL